MKLTASIDRFESNLAILMVDDVKFELPRKYLPTNIRAGGWVDIQIEENKEKEAEVHKNISKLLDELKKGQHLD